MSDSGCEWPSESRSEIGNEVIRLRAELAAMTAEAARVREITGTTFDGEVQQGESLYAAFLKLRDERDTLQVHAEEDARVDAEVQTIVGKYMEDIVCLEAQVESTNALLRAASADMEAIREELGPQEHSGSIADAVKALVAKCERLSVPVSDKEANKYNLSVWTQRKCSQIITTRAGEVQP